MRLPELVAKGLMNEDLKRRFKENETNLMVWREVYLEKSIPERTDSICKESGKWPYKCI